MKQVVCREDIKAELDMLSDMKLTIQMLESQISMLQDRLELLEAKSSVINTMNTSVSVPISTGDIGYGQSVADLVNIRRAAAEVWSENGRTVPDGHWDMNGDGTVTFVRN